MTDVGELKVWYIPQIPMKAFEVSVESVKEGQHILDILTDFSSFEYDNSVKPDYSDACGISRYESDGEGGFDWYDVDPEGDDD